ncbi:MAG: GNAT family N-acetyltransferase [Duncaniella sp.]|nr:GNAT family N-acetyltransferase [Duncaniella sp.]
MVENPPAITCDSLIPRIIDCGTCRLRPLGRSDISWLECLLSEDSVAEFITSPPGYAGRLVDGNESGRSIAMCVENIAGEPVGYIFALPVIDCYPSMPRWKLEFAVSPRHRGHGYATEAVGAMTAYLLRRFSLPRVVADICDADSEARRVVEKCGFARPESRYAYVNYDNVWQGVRYMWYKLQSGRRALCFAKGMQYYRLRRFVEAAGMWHEALGCNYDGATPYDDRMILANIGMAYSSAGMYVPARLYLGRAAAIAGDSAYILDELRWISVREGSCITK